MKNKPNHPLEDFDIFDPRFYNKLITKFYSIWENSFVKVKKDPKGVRKNFLAIVKTLYEKGDSILTLYSIDMSVKEMLRDYHFGSANLSRTLDILKEEIIESRTSSYRLNGQTTHYLDQIFLKSQPS